MFQSFSGNFHPAIKSYDKWWDSMTQDFVSVTPDEELNEVEDMLLPKVIAAAPQLGLKRQIFFARIGGWDLHDAQLSPHAALFADVSRSVAALYRTTVELGCADQVALFTASDFGRTYNTNGDGSDHGWGSNHLVVGGAVKGGDIYGKMADLTIRGPDDASTRGSWIPTTSVDEYAAPLASWFGVSATNLPIVFPNLGRFPRANVGFL